MKTTKMLAILVSALGLMVLPASGGQSLTVNGGAAEAVILKVGQVCTVEVVSDDSNPYDAYAGFDDGITLGSFSHQQTLPETGDLNDVTEYSVPAFYGYYVEAAGTSPAPSPGVHFVFQYQAQVLGDTDVKLYDATLTSVIDSVHITVVHAEMGTSFTYQGSLNDAGSPADGLYDFEFELYDAPSDGNQLGSTIDINDLDVIEGQFAIELDFGSDAFDGSAVWLETTVAHGDGNDPCTLRPRVEITPTPYALYAKTAGYAQTAGGIPGGISGSGTANYVAKFTGPNTLADSTIYEYVGNVGIGTSTPEAKLSIQMSGKPYPTLPPFIAPGLVIKGGSWNFGNQFEVQDPSGNTRFLVDSAGNVGIGTTTPDEKLHISGTPGVDGIKFPDGTVQTTSAAELSALIATLEARIEALEKPPGWGMAEQIETDNAGEAYLPQVAVDGSGNAVAVWNQWDGTRYNIWSNRYVAGTGWGTAELIETDNAGHAYGPQLAVDGGGNAVAVWRQSDGTRDNIWSNRYVAGTGWSAAELIETDNAGNASLPQVAVDVGGNAVAVWEQSDGTRDNIWSNRYVAGTGWGTAEQIETDNAGWAWFPQVAVDVGGNAVAVWYQGDGTRDNIWSNRYVAGTGWGTAEQIETDNAGNAGYPQVAVDVGGNAVAVWRQHDGTRNNIWSNRYVAGTGWGTAEQIETDNAGNAKYPQVAVDGSGNAIAVWEQYDGTRDNIWSNRYVAGTGWSAAELIETDNAGNASFPEVAVDVGGNAVAVWRQHDGTRDNIWSNRYVAGTGWGTAELIETDNAGDARYQHVAVDVGGNAVAVWCQHDGTRDNIWSNRYVNEE